MLNRKLNTEWKSIMIKSDKIRLEEDSNDIKSNRRG